MPDWGLHHLNEDEDLKEVRKLWFTSRKEAEVFLDEIWNEIMGIVGTVGTVEYDIEWWWEFQWPVFPVKYDSVDVGLASESWEPQWSKESNPKPSSELSLDLCAMKSAITSADSTVWLVRIIEWILDTIKLSFKESRNIYKHKERLYLLYGDKKTMRSSGQDGLPVLELSDGKFFLRTFEEIEPIRDFALYLLGVLEAKYSQIR